jgi:energy-converting hydrogenase Eha subunit E
MKKNSLILISILAISVLLLTGTFVKAENPSPSTTTLPYEFVPPQTSLDIWGMLKQAAKWLLAITAGVAVIMIVWAGFTYVTAGGDSEKTKKSLNIIIYALVGLTIAFLAYWIVYMLATFLNIQQMQKITP